MLSLEQIERIAVVAAARIRNEQEREWYDIAVQHRSAAPRQLKMNWTRPIDFVAYVMFLREQIDLQRKMELFQMALQFKNPPPAPTPGYSRA